MTTTSSTTTAPGPRVRRRRIYLGSVKVPWLFAVPAIVIILLLRYIPSIAGGAYAFTDWNGSSLSANWAGVSNFQKIFADPAVSGALWHTLVLAVLFVIIVNIVGLALALSLRTTLKTKSVLRALFFLPFALSQLATAYIWQFVFAYDGPLNVVLKAVGLGGSVKSWLSDPQFALIAILVVVVWQYTGLTMIIYLAGLEGISEEITDAAAVDGASFLQRFRWVTLPLLAPAMTIAISLTLIFGLGVFDQILGLTGGGPVDSTQTIATQVWQQTFVYGNFAQGSALALLFAALVSVLALLQVFILRIRERRLEK
ncbi:MAG TPA: sugar ABC transporter permease, partial [Thermomicrobiales bacterium]|nr:sugar ABC transporter permease [Thermomicrobiales bacterium]